jgi:hypothetical protein
MAASVVNISLAINDDPTGVVRQVITDQGTSGRRLLTRLARLFTMCAGGVRASIVSCRVDSSTDAGTNKPMDRMTRTNTITQASLVDNTDTLKFGNVVTLTWKTSPSGENEVAIGASDTAAGDNLASKINNHSKLKGIFTAVNVSGVVTITYTGDPRLGAIIGLAEAGNGQVLSGTNFALDTTEVYASASVRYVLGNVD